MSVPSVEQLVASLASGSADPGWLVPLAALGAAFLGSAHCAAMCGGLAAASSQDRASLRAYQLSRLGGYALLGALGGFFGERILAREALAGPALIAALLMSLVLVLSGLSLWGVRWSRAGSAWLEARLTRASSGRR